MPGQQITRIRKRDGSIVPFDSGKIEAAIYKAFVATATSDAKERSAELSRRVVEIIEERLRYTIPAPSHHSRESGNPG